ncbi:MAG: hypothetical protein HXX08_04295 [Chloroflexi bacterium]|uniref:Uncharacterized protein n=1 Tax=Candidatus Chlorohelix allophototropha TaxID=3003348 RepID=A0A8T7M0U8_9CHLR|nr:hypothetical protein [Chloroflexota bacterium]WJW66961.1 hypothetical protein OZ401_000207 [Chloroflexota bacterium L227-S17]
MSVTETEEKTSAKSPVMRFITYLLDKQIHFIVLGLAIAYLAYSWFSIQVKYTQIQSYDFMGAISISYRDTNLYFFRDTGDSRPVIASQTSDRLLEYRDWNSSITVNGNSLKLWDTSNGYNVDSQNAKLYQSMSRNDWVVFKEVTLGPDPKRVLVEYYYRNDKRASDVSLELGHYGNFVSTKVNKDNFEAVVGSGLYVVTPKAGQASGQTGLEPSVIGWGTTQSQTPRYLVNLKINTAALKNVELAIKNGSDVSEQGTLQNVVTTYSLKSISLNQRVLLASEEIIWQDLSN